MVLIIFSKIKSEYQRFRKSLESRPIIASSEETLSEHMSTLVNNRQGSDVQFRVSTGRQNQQATVTLYAHSYILRCRSQYFAAMLGERENWNDSAECIISKPDVSSNTFQDILRYIYTGDTRPKNLDNIVELIRTAKEMGLEELKTKCHTELIRTVKSIFSDEDNHDEVEDEAWPILPINVAIQTHIIPALNIPNNTPISDLSEEVRAIILPKISFIINSPNVYTEFVNGISSEALTNIIVSDNIEMTERNIWDLVLDWVCHQTNLPKLAVEAGLRKSKNSEENRGVPLNTMIISNDQLDQFKRMLEPFLPHIRFSLLNPDDYTQLMGILKNILPQYSELNKLFLEYDGTGLLHSPRMNSPGQKMPSRIVIHSATWKILRKSIFETGGITGCRSVEHLKFELIFRAHKHGFANSAFHQRCDNKGPTIVIVRSSDGHLFGGVNFNRWKSNTASWSSPLNFLFAIPDGHYRTDFALFKIGNQPHDRRSFNYSTHGPTFGSCNDFSLPVTDTNGWHDLCIADSANTNQHSHSYLPHSYKGDGASRTALAGAQNFTVSDYEVFTISKYM